MLNDAINLADIKRVLVIKLRHHGDVLLTSPVFTALKKAGAHLSIDALIYQDTREMLNLHPDLDQIWCIDPNWKKLSLLKQGQAEWQLLKQLKERQFDLIVHLTPHKRGAWLTRYLRPRYAVAPNESSHFFRKSFTHTYPVIAGNRRHTVEIHLDALRRLGIYPKKDQRQLTLKYSADTKHKVSKLLAEHDLLNRPYIVIHPASRWFFKCWPAPAMKALLHALQQRHIRVILTGAPDPFEASYIQQILPQSPLNLLNLQGQLSLKELAIVIEKAQLFIGMDSVPMHIAAAMQTPTIALFGPSGDIEWGPWQVPHRILTAPQFSCRPCGRDGCGGGKRSECLEAISVREVLAAMDELITRL
jgi:heptosyltransferase-3